MVNKKPNFFILGAPKCGTTSLVHWLSDHPEIYMSPIKEPHFFNTDHNYHLVHSEKEYYKLFSNVEDEHKAIGEASVWYLYSEDAVRNIEEQLPNSKYIVMLRNPVEMMISLHQQQLFSGNENVEDFKRAWEIISKRKKGNKIPPLCREPKHLFYDEVCKLGTQLENLFKQVDEERIKVIFLDEIKEDPRIQYEEILNFLGVKSINKDDFSVINQAKVRKSKLLRNLIKIYIWIRHKFKLPRLNTGMMKKIDMFNREKKKLSLDDNEFRKALLTYFKDDIYKIEKITNYDLTSWKELNA